MPSLRERSKRPSYALLATGLEGLSDEEERDSDASQAEGSQAGSRRRAASGGSTDFDPTETTQYKRKGKGKGKAKAVSIDDDSGSEFEGPSSEEEDDDMADDVVDENEAEQEEEDEDEKEEHEIGAERDGEIIAPLVRPRPRNIPSAFSNAPSHSKQATYVQSEANLIPQQYRQLIVKHAETIAAPFRGKPSAQPKERDYKARTLDPGVMPYGPNTPYVTRLKKEVRGREGAQVIYDQHLGRGGDVDDDKFERQRYMAMVLKYVSLLAPWQVWQGEGWWPEMAPGHPAVIHGSRPIGGAVQTKEKGIPQTAEGWTRRDEVRLGLDRVGRYTVDQMEMLSKDQAKPYMPTTTDANGNPHMTFNIGLHDKQNKLDIKALDSFPLGQFNPSKSGFTFSAGGPIWGLDWCPFPKSKSAKYDHTQYLAISTMPHLDTKAAIGEKWPADSLGSIQIWGAIPPTLDPQDKVVDAGNMSCDLILCLSGGPVVDLKWMPMGSWDDDDGSGIPKLGIIAACQLDGSLSFYAVPQPEELRQKNGAAEGATLYLCVDKPLLKLDLPDAMCTCVDFVNGGRVICGTSTGFLAIWDVLEPLKNPGLGAPLPVMYISAAQSFIKSVAVGRDPPEDANGYPDHTGDPVYAVCASHDATVAVIDLRDREQHFEVTRSRMPHMAVSWSNQLGCPLWADTDHSPQMYDPRGRYVSKSYVFAHHRGPVWSLSASDYHTMVVSGSADGSVLLSNLNAGWFRRRGGGMIYQRLFEIDYDTFSGEYRILDDFLPEEMSLDGAQQKNNNKAKGTSHSLEGNPLVAKSGDWSPHVGVHQVCWNNNNGLGKAGWVASGTASGLGRIDIIRGRFTHGKVPNGLGP